MAVVEERPAAAPLPVADPAPLGLAAFALTTFMLSGHNANFIPDLIWVGVALFYGGAVQLFAGMWEFRNRNVFGATAFSTYGGFWLSLGIFVVFAVDTKLGVLLTGKTPLANSLAWFLFAFAIFNTYMLLWSTRVNGAVFAVFLTLEVTEILLAIGFWVAAHRGIAAPSGANVGWIRAGGWAGIVTAATAWYASAGLVLRGMAGREILPLGRPFWTGTSLPIGRSATPARAR
ncbi:MAG: acetate uptake transporter [Gaiellaceae bacterium]